MSEEVGSPVVNTPVVGSTEIVVRGGGTVSDEMLDSLEASEQQSATNEVEQEAQKAIAVEEKTQELKKGQAERELAKAIRKWKAITGDGSELELSDDVKFKVPVNKQEQDVPLADLIESYNGDFTFRKLIPQRFSELDLERKSFEMQKRELNSKLQEIIDIAPKNSIEAFRRLAKMIKGKDADQYVDQFMSAAQSEFEKWNKMTPEEKLRHQEMQKFETEKADVEKAKAELAKQKEAQEFEAYAQQVCEHNGVSEEEVAAGWKDISEAVLKMMPNASKKEMLNQTVRYVFLTKQYARIGEQVAKLDPERSQDPGYLQRIAKYIDPDFTESDIAEIIKEDLGASRTDDTETSKKSSARTVSKPKPAAAPKRASSASARVSDEDLEDGLFTDL